MAEAAVVFTSCVVLAGHGQDMAQGAASPALSGLIAEVTPLGFIAVRCQWCQKWEFHWFH